MIEAKIDRAECSDELCIVNLSLLALSVLLIIDFLKGEE